MINLLQFIFLTIFTLSNCLTFAQKGIYNQEEKNWIKENPTVYFGYDPNWPPYEIYSNGKYTGICADFTTIISKKSGIKFVPIKNMTWEKSFHQLTNDGLMMAPAVGITPDRQKILIYSEVYVKLPTIIVTTKDNSDLNQLDKLNLKKVSIPKNYLQEEILKRDYPNIQLVFRKNFAECLQDVSSGRSEATVGSLGAISYFMKENGFTNLTISGHTNYNGNGVAFAFPKSQETLRNIVDKTLKTISQDERSKIYSKWISINFIDETDNKTFWKYLIIIAVIVILILSLFILWNKSLRKQIYLRKQIEDELQHTLEEVNKQNNDKTILLQEIHHRVKNNLQIIISLLRLQTNSHTNSDVKEALQEAIERINSISMVHEHIYKNPNLAEIDLTGYVQNLGEELKRIFIRDKEIVINVECHATQLHIRPIIPLALILNELFTNSLKYAFSDQNSGSIDIDLKIQDNQLIMVYKDSGKWFNNIYTRNFGTYLIEIFTDQLNGSFVRENDVETKYLFEFKDFI